MANPLRGEVELKVKDGAYTLRFSIDAICGLEEEIGKSFARIMVELSNPELVTLTLVRKVFRAALSEHHPDLTLRQAGEIIEAAGGVLEVVTKINKAVGAAFGTANSGNPAESASGNGSRPRRRAEKKARTGSPS